MGWRRVLCVGILGCLFAAGPSTSSARVSAWASGQDTGDVEESGVPQEASELGEAQQEAKRKKRQERQEARRERLPEATEDSEPGDAQSTEGETDDLESDQAEDPDVVRSQRVLVPCVSADVGSEDEGREDESQDQSPDQDRGNAETEDPTEGNSEEKDESDCDPDRPGVLVLTTDAPSSAFVAGAFAGRVEPDEPLEVRVKLGEIALRVISREPTGATWEKTVTMEEPSVLEVRIRMQRAVRLMRKEERKTGIFRDAKTSLMWPKRDNGLDVDLRQAYAYCRDLQTGGYGDWRLPTLRELESLQAIWQRSAYKIQGGILLTECCVWSSDYDGASRASTFNFRYRKDFQTNAGYELGLRALCVRPWDQEAEPEEKGGSRKEESGQAEEGDPLAADGPALP